MAKTRRKYKGNATSTTIPSGLASGATLCTVAAATGWPTSGPFYAVIDPGSSSEEKILVASISGTSLSSITRGVDDTTDQTHASNCTIYPVFTAVDADEANELASTWTTKGDLVAHGASTFVRVAVGTNNHVLMADSTQASGLKYALVGENNLASDAVTTAKIADSAVTSAKIANGTIVEGDLADGAVTSAKIADGTIVAGDIASDAVTEAKILNGSVTVNKLGDGAVTSAKILDGTIVDGDINASAAIALSKLATGALPTAITVASANIVDGTILNADINASANIALSKLATGALPTAITVTTDNIVNGTIVEADLADGSVSAAKVKAEAWTSYTPTVSQPSAISGITVNYAKYIQFGKTVLVNGSLTLGASSGTSGNSVTVSLPITSATSAIIPVGSGTVFDASAFTTYSATCTLASTTTFNFTGDWGGAAQWGSTPSIGLASGDIIRFSLSYEAA